MADNSHIDPNDSHFKELRDRARRQRINDKNFIAQLKQARVSAGISVEELAFRLGVTEFIVEVTEDGQSDPPLSMIRQYANAVGCMVEYTVSPDVPINDDNDDNDDNTMEKE